MLCSAAETCGGCRYRDLAETAYRDLKQSRFAETLSGISGSAYKINPPVFVKDGSRRRASMAFAIQKKQLVLGFNQEASHQIINIENCPLLTPGINQVLPFVRQLLTAVCSEPYTEKKGKKSISRTIGGGDVFICEADNGIDLVLEYDAPLELSHRMTIFEMSQDSNNIIRISHRRSPASEAETIIEKSKPFIKAGGYEVFIPAGTFLQPSGEGQEALAGLVLRYLSETKGRIADLFCGVGTFSYMLASLQGVQITAVDSSAPLLKGFQESLNRNQITNVKIINKNLFKYPLSADELKDFTAVVFDPPRAGAKAVCRELAAAESKPEIVVAVSCNPATFVNDANMLIAGGYDLQEVTMVDQFIYSNHSELVAFFTKRQM